MQFLQWERYPYLLGSPVRQSLVLSSRELVADPSGQRGKPKLDETPARPRASDAKSTVVLEWGLNYVPRASDKSLYSSEPQFPHTSNEGRWEDQTREGDVQLAPLHTSQILAILTKSLNMRVHAPGAHLSWVASLGCRNQNRARAGWTLSSQPPAPAQRRRCWVFLRQAAG